MARFSKFNIDLKTLPDGTHSYSYELDRSYFEAIDHEDVRKGNVQVELIVEKTNGAYEFNFHSTGTVQIPCDRCLDEMNQEIDTHNRLIVELGEEYSEESDEIVIIPADEGAINIAWYMYEFIVLDIPIKHVHMPGMCNKFMTKKYRQHQAVAFSDSDSDSDEGEDALTDELDDDFDEDIEEKDESLEDIDPRWEALKQLKEKI